MTTNTITERFGSQMRGYDKNQVDRYIEMLTDEYEKLQNEYASQTTQFSINMEIISKVLVDAETNAKQIIADAEEEATRLLGSAHVELRKLQQEKIAVIDEINAIAYGLREIVARMG